MPFLVITNDGEVSQSAEKEPDDDQLEDAINEECVIVKLEGDTFVQLNPSTAMWEEVQAC